MTVKKRLINDEELAKFVEVGRTGPWSLVIDIVMTNSPYGVFGFDGQPHTYSSKSLHPNFNPDEEVSPLTRAFWNAPALCDYTTPIFLHICQEAMPDYGWAMYRLYQEYVTNNSVEVAPANYEGDTIGHSECVGTDPVTGDIVALGLNVDDVKVTLEKSGYPDSPIREDETVLTLLAIARQQFEEVAA